MCANRAQTMWQCALSLEHTLPNDGENHTVKIRRKNILAFKYRGFSQLSNRTIFVANSRFPETRLKLFKKQEETVGDAEKSERIFLFIEVCSRKTIKKRYWRTVIIRFGNTSWKITGTMYIERRRYRRYYRRQKANDRLWNTIYWNYCCEIQSIFFELTFSGILHGASNVSAVGDTRRPETLFPKRYSGSLSRPLE